jgi:pilus assembly protein CpaB
MRAPHLPYWLSSRWVRRARIGAALLLTALALLGAVAGPPGAPAAESPGGTTVPVAAKDLVGGSVLAAADVTVTRLPASAVPAGVLPSVAAAIGRTLAGAVRRGEPLTDARVVGPSLARLAGGPGTVAVPVRLADPGVARLLRPGDRVDVVSVAQSGTGSVIVAAAPVLALPSGAGDPADIPAGSTVEGALVVLAVPAYLAPQLSSTALSTRITVTLRPP